MHRQEWKRLAQGSVLLAALASPLASPSVACAQTKKPAAKAAATTSDALEILGVVSDDVEEQADALTEALRYEARQIPGVTLGKATQTLDVMTTANKCPQSPDPTCQQDIAKQLKTTQYIWGVLKKSPEAKVTIELHHYVKDKPDHFLSVVYAANLRDQNDEALRKVAKRLLVELLGVKTGFVHITGTGKMATCNVKLDGQVVGQLRETTLLTETTPGEHTITTDGCPAFTATTTVPTSGEIMVTLTEPGQTAPGGMPPKEKPSYFTGRKIAGISMIGAGVVSGVVGVIFLTRYLGNRSAPGDNGATWQISPTGAANVGTSAKDVCANQSASAQYFNGTASTVKDICSEYSSAKTNSTVAIITGAVGGALIVGGAVLWATDKKQESSLGKLRLEPSLGKTNGLWLSGAF